MRKLVHIIGAATSLGVVVWGALNIAERSPNQNSTDAVIARQKRDEKDSKWVVMDSIQHTAQTRLSSMNDGETNYITAETPSSNVRNKYGLAQIVHIRDCYEGTAFVLFTDDPILRSPIQKDNDNQSIDKKILFQSLLSSTHNGAYERNRRPMFQFGGCLTSNKFD